MTDTAAIPTLTTADVETAIDKAVAEGLPRPAWQVVGGDHTPFINIGLANRAEVDRWAAHVGAKVGHGDVTYIPLNADPFHEYGTNAPGSVYGSWLGRHVYVSCQVAGPHPQPA